VGTPICSEKDQGAEVVHALGRISSIKTPNGLEIDCSAEKGVVSIKVRALYIYLEYNFEVRSL
jgi:translation initiation factor 5B